MKIGDVVFLAFAAVALGCAAWDRCRLSSRREPKKEHLYGLAPYRQASGRHVGETPNDEKEPAQMTPMMLRWMSGVIVILAGMALTTCVVTGRNDREAEVRMAPLATTKAASDALRARAEADLEMWRRMPFPPETCVPSGK